MGADEDIATDPFLYQWAPDPKHDSPLRKIQHWIFFVPFSFLFALWRVDSLKVAVDAVENKRPGAKGELYSLLIHYIVLFIVGVNISSVSRYVYSTELYFPPTYAPITYSVPVGRDSFLDFTLL